MRSSWIFQTPDPPTGVLIRMEGEGDTGAEERPLRPGRGCNDTATGQGHWSHQSPEEERQDRLEPAGRAQPCHHLNYRPQASGLRESRCLVFEVTKSVVICSPTRRVDRLPRHQPAPSPPSCPTPSPSRMPSFVHACAAGRRVPTGLCVPRHGRTLHPPHGGRSVNVC